MKFSDMAPHVRLEHETQMERDYAARMVAKTLANIQRHVDDLQTKLAAGRTVYEEDGSNLAAYAVELTQHIVTMRLHDKALERARNMAYAEAYNG